jgi:hypothetical protein
VVGVTKYKSVFLICLASLLLTSCNGASTNYPVNRLSFSEYQDSLKNFDNQLSTNGYTSWSNGLDRWWDCESYRSASYYLETENEVPWKLFGYCLSSIDLTINQYLWLKVYKEPEHLDDATVTFLKKLSPNSKQSLNQICTVLITAEIENEFKQSSQGNKNLKFVSSEVNDAIISGCVLRFTDILNLQIKWAKLGMIDQQARIKAAEEEELLQIEAQKQAEVLNSIDTNSREYITGLTIGNNFSDYSDAGAIAEKVCATARDRRVVLSSRGGIGVDPKTASFLNTNNGFQGCIDGFNGVPQD